MGEEKNEKGEGDEEESKEGQPRFSASEKQLEAVREEHLLLRRLDQARDGRDRDHAGLVLLVNRSARRISSDFFTAKIVRNLRPRSLGEGLYSQVYF